MGLVHTRTGLAQATEDPLLQAFDFSCHPILPYKHPHEHPYLIHYFMAELVIQSAHGLLHWCTKLGLDRLRGLLSYRVGPSGDG